MRGVFYNIFFFFVVITWGKKRIEEHRLLRESTFLLSKRARDERVVPRAILIAPVSKTRPANDVTGLRPLLAVRDKCIV